VKIDKKNQPFGAKRNNMKKYKVTDRATNNWDIFESDILQECKDCIIDQERSDKNEDQYEPDFYQIINNETGEEV
jgi:hypothetical protein